MGDAQRWQNPDYDRGGWRPVPVPMALDHYDPAMDGYEGVGWYAISLPADRVAPQAWQRLRFRRGFTNDFPTYFGPFGIVTFDRSPKKAHAALRALWTGTAAEPRCGAGSLHPER